MQVLRSEDGVSTHIFMVSANGIAGFYVAAALIIGAKEALLQEPSSSSSCLSS